jgi:uncharacterized protein
MKILNLKEKVKSYYMTDDPAHDWNHVERVAFNAKSICDMEKVDSEITLAAVYCHDLINLPKNHPDRAKASELSAQEAEIHLRSVGFNQNEIEQIKQGITQHSYSRGEKPSSIHSAIVQDADRLDAIGAIGIIRCAVTAGKLNSKLYSPADPLGENRVLDDKKFMIDHYFLKLFKLPDLMNTESAKKIAQERVQFMKSFLSTFNQEISYVDHSI